MMDISNTSENLVSSYLDIVVPYLTKIEYFTWLLHYSVALIFVFAEVKSALHFRNFALVVEKFENDGKHFEFFGKNFCYLALIILSFIELFICSYTGRLHHDYIYVFFTIIVGTSLVISTWNDYNYKLSVENSTISRVKFYEIKFFILWMVAGETVTTLRKIGDSFHFDDNDSPDKSFWILFFARAVFFTILAIEPWTPEEDESTGVKENGGTGDEKKTSHSFLSALTYFYPMRKYLIPETPLTKLYLLLLLGLVGLDSFMCFLTSIYSMKILNSLQVDNYGQNETRNTNSTDPASASGQFGKLRLEFRWDYIMTYFIIQLFQGNFIYLIKFYLRTEVQKASCSRLQIAIFGKLHELSIRWHIENKANEVFSLMSSAPLILEDLLYNFVWVAPSVMGMFLTLTYLINSYSFNLSSIVIATSIISTLIDVYILKKRDRDLKKLMDTQSETRNCRSASFENYETVKYFTNEEYEKNLYAKVYEEEADQQSKSTYIYDIFAIGRDLLQYSTQMVVILIVVKLIVDEKGLSTGDYSYFLGVFQQILSPFESFISFLRDIQRHALSAEKVGNLLNTVPEIMDEPGAPELEIDSNGGSIEFRNVNFSYIPDRQILNNLNMVIPAGHTVALVGHSGCGKSTITKLIFRFYDPTDGEILVNGVNIRKVQCHSLRKAIGVVPQDIILFDESIRDNIKYGKILDATDDEIIEAAQTACLHTRIESFPEKYETEVGSRGLKLSGGEKQRVAIARTVLKNPPILVLDEATSSLDTETEKQIQVSLEKLCKNRTTVIIAHRLSTIVHANTIFVFKEGTVVESGTHTHLLALNGVYTGMWNQQFTAIRKTVSEENRESVVKKADLRKRRQIFSSRQQQTIWSVMARRAFTMES